MLFPENVGKLLSLDETALSNGDLYTILTNKGGKGRKGTLVAIVKGTASEAVITVLKRIPESIRNEVKEITLDMAGSMNRIAQKCFPKSTRVIDRFLHNLYITFDSN